MTQVVLLFNLERIKFKMSLLFQPPSYVVELNSEPMGPIDFPRLCIWGQQYDFETIGIQILKFCYISGLRTIFRVAGVVVTLV